VSKPFTDESGKAYFYLTLIKLHHKDSNFRPHYLCRCKCGKEKVIRLDCIKSGNTKSCGCYSKEFNKKRLLTYITKHGGSGTRLYKTWKNMRERCSAFGKKKGKNYADMGVTVCEEWNDFEVFRDWAINNDYADNLTLDRIDVTCGYEPSNCRWITLQEQERNRRNSIYIEYNGVRKHLKEWAEELNIKYHTLYQRYKKNKEPELVLRPYKHGNKVI